MKEIILEKIRRIQQNEKMSVTAFAKKIGMDQVTVNNQFLGKRSLSLDTVINVVNAFPGVSAEWLLRDIGEMDEQSSIIKENERLKSMTGTISILTDTIQEKERTIAALQARIAELEKLTSK